MKLSALLYVVSALFASQAFATPSLLPGLSYEGQILKPGGSPVLDTAVQFKIQIRTPDAGSCLMFEETQTKNMANSNGNFSLTINDGSVARTDLTGLTLERIFANRGTFTLDAAKCDGGGTGTYIPNATDARRLQVQFKDSMMGTWETIPEEMLNFAPLAIEAKQVQGFGADSLLRVVNGSLDPQTGISPLSNAEYGLLQQLIAGTSTLYTRAGQLNGANMPAMTTSQVLGWNGSAWTSVNPLAGVSLFAQTALPPCSVNYFLRNNGAGSFECVAPAGGGSGTVTQVNTGTGLTGGGFTTTGTISISNQGVDTAQLKDGGVTLIKMAADSVDSTKIVDGSITANDLASNIQIYTTSSVTANSYLLKSGPNSISLNTPGLSGSYNLTLPPDGGTNGYVLSTNGSGITSWVSPSGGSQWTTVAPGINYMVGSVGIGSTSPSTKLQVAGSMIVGDGGETCGITYAGAIRYSGGNLQFCNGTPPWSTLGVAGSGISSLTGDVTATGTGSVAATVATVGTSTAANVHAAELLANAATSANTLSTIVKRDSSGNFTAGALTLTSAKLSQEIYKDSATNTVTVQAPSTVGTSYVLKWPTNIAATSGQVLSSDTVGNLSWTTLSTAPTGAASGDLSGTYPSPTVATIGTSTAANLHAAELTANAATAINTASTIVKRDGSNAFAAGVITTDGVTLKNAGSLLNIVNPVGGAWTMTLPATAGSNNQVLTTNGSGLLSWATPGSGDFKSDGSVSMVGAMKLVSGNAATPGLAFATDPNSGMYLSAASTVGLSAGGSTVMKMKPSQVMVSDTYPASTGYFVTNFSPSNPAVAQAAGASFIYNPSYNATASVGTYGAYVANGILQSSGTTTTSQTGIQAETTVASMPPSGTLSQQFGVRSIYGSTTSAGTITNAYGLYSQLSSGTSSSSNIGSSYGLLLDAPTGSGTITNRYGIVQADQYATNKFLGRSTFGVGGSLGIDPLSVSSADSSVYLPSSSPNQPWSSGLGSALTIGNSDTTTGTAAYLGFSVKSSSFTNKAYIGAVSNSGYTPSLVFGSSLSSSTYQERMRIDSSGNVGIGTSSPAYKLTVGGAIAPATDNLFDLGSSTNRFANVYAANSVVQTSDRRQKKDIESSDLGLAFINDLAPVSYHWIEGDKDVHYGVIAQETAAAVARAKGISTKEAGNVIVSHDEKSDRFGVKYTELISPLIKAVQEFYAEFRSSQTEMKAELASVKAENAELKARLDHLEQRMDAGH